jgi:hypothetical protein
MNIYTDKIIGFWIKDLPYYIENSKRYYFTKFIDFPIPKLNKKCKEIVEFTNDSSKLDKLKIYMNGNSYMSLYMRQYFPFKYKKIEFLKKKIKK